MSTDNHSFELPIDPIKSEGNPYEVKKNYSIYKESVCAIKRDEEDIFRLNHDYLFKIK